MKLTQENQTITIQINEEEMVYYYEKQHEGSKIVGGVSGTIEDNLFRYDGLTITKSGRGRLKKEKDFYKKLDQVELFLNENGFKLSY